MIAFYTFKAILCTFNKNIIRFNNQVLVKFFEINIVCNNRNQIVNEKNNFLLFIEFINEFEFVSLLFHYLKLKSNCVVMLLRNLKFVRDLYNETRF